MHENVHNVHQTEFVWKKETTNNDSDINKCAKCKRPVMNAVCVVGVFI